tara:strand:- start:1076 stop:2146 length:1071 start_codon:yes stop_codon:yes gene_type:complete
MKFKIGELFCGPGGLSLGAVKANRICNDNGEFFINHGWATDFDLDSCNTYLNNIDGATKSSVIHKDVKDLDIDSLGEINCFAYGFPCNDFSLVGEQKGFRGKFGPLYSYGLKVIEKFNPLFFVAENVGGMSSANEGKAFKKILDDLSNSGLGYKLTVNKYKSEEYGVPQTRHRIIIVGIRKDLNLKFKVPSPIILNPKNFISSREALENPPISSLAKNHEFTRQSKNVVERLKYIMPGKNVWNSNIPKELQLNVKGAKLSQIYRRLDPDKPSYTITGSGGGGTHGYHYSENRALTNRERARIQTFPDNYFFEGSKESVRKQIGMAVPPKLSKIIFGSILKLFAGIDYKSVKPNIKI